MKIIVGLGNPGKEYENTRHNAGFIFVDKLSESKEIAPIEGLKFQTDKKLKVEYLKTQKDGETIYLIKPQTFMNSSGEAVSKFLQYYKAGIQDLIVVADDKDLPLGQVRIRGEGASAGQKGLQNIIDILGSESFPRIRIGIGPDAKEIDSTNNLIETSDYVLSQFSKRELPIINKVIEEAVEYLVHIIGKKDGRLTSHTINVE